MEENVQDTSLFAIIQKNLSMLPKNQFKLSRTYVAHASSSADLSIFEATIFGIGAVGGLKPNKMAVIKTKNPNKKLGWM